MATHKITLLPGDGIGPEVTASVVAILECSGVDIEWEKYSVGSEALSQFGDPLPQEVLDSILRNKIALKGPTATPVGTGSVGQRAPAQEARPLREPAPGAQPARRQDALRRRRLVVVRENTEDLYAGLEHIVVPGVVE